MPKILKQIIALLSSLIIWQFLVFLFSSFLPSPIELARALKEGLLNGEILVNIFSSLQKVLAGFLLAAIFGIFLGLLLGYYEKIGDYIKPIIELFRAIPPIAWIPIAILVFGIGNSSAYFIVFLGAFFPIFTNTYFGVLSLPKIYRNISDSFEIKRTVFLKKILFKFSLPYIFAGLKIGMGMAWMSVIAAELVSSQSGLGYFIQLNRLLLRTDNIVLGMLLIGLLGLLLTKILEFAGRKATPWIK